ncbi:hypothetical protein A2U01_0054178 [Trifolium medium]|uniref:Uncharacterized protein n=1 Tax=Trifolium medium TaxID=97028 RepID=A0A392R8P3_9FABA|nr:hypothetical protein [Trifolium medium]
MEIGHRKGPNRRTRKQWCGGRSHRTATPIGYISKVEVGYDGKAHSGGRLKRSQRIRSFRERGRIRRSIVIP